MIATVSVQANDLRGQRQPTVVYEGPGTVIAQTYYRRLERNGRNRQSAITSAGADVRALEGRFPLIPKRLRVGSLELRTQEGLFIPLFIMGMDTLSLEWFRRNAQTLSELGARGVVVEASNANDWLSLQQRASDSGIQLMLLAGDSLAEGYQASTYPVVFVSPALAQEYLRE